jgi:hypothetical protein
MTIQKKRRASKRMIGAVAIGLAIIVSSCFGQPSAGTTDEEYPVTSANKKLSPFAPGATHFWGVSLEYFSYAEHSTLNDIFPDWPDSILNSPFIQGKPKSTEYGLMFGINYEATIRDHGSPLLFRPNVAVQFGFHQTYDGSSQDSVITDNFGNILRHQFFPIKDNKSNYFLQAGLDVGYSLFRTTVPFYLYSGLKGNLWYRDLVADTTSYSNQVTSSELYYWFTMPVGVAVSMPVSSTLTIGIDACCDLLFFGQMQAFDSWWDSDTTANTVSPAVTLGDRIGCHVELPITFEAESGTVYRFVPYVKIYSFGKSETQTSKNYINNNYQPGQDQTFWEPASSSWLIGIKLQVVSRSSNSRAN